MKQWKKLLVFLCGVFLVFGLSGMASADLIIENGTFQNGAPTSGYTTLGAGTSIDGWTVGGEGVDWVSYWTGSDGSLTSAIDMDATGPGTISQILSTTSGSTYTIQFDMAGNPDHFGSYYTYYNPKLLTVTANGGQAQDYSFDVSGKSSDNMGWVTQTFTFTADSDLTTLTFASGSPEGSPWGAAIDNVTDPPPPPNNVPEPATLLLLGSSLIGLAVVGKKKLFRKTN